MELGRPAPMLTSAWPGRAAAMVPAPVEGREVRGHRQRSPNSAAPTAIGRVFALKFQAGEIALFIPWHGWQPRNSGAGLGWRDGGAGAELPGRSRTRARSKLRRRAIGRVFALKFQAGEIALFIPWRGWQPRNLARAWGGVMAVPALSYRVGRERELDRSCAGGLSGVCSLSNFRLARSRSLSLGAGGSRGIWRGLGVACMAVPALSYRVGRERELDRSCAGGLSGVCSLSNFRLARSRSLSLGAGGSRGIWRGLGVASMAVPALSYRVGRERELDRSCAGGLSGVCSLSNFRLARSRSLSLGAGGSRGIWRGEISNKRKQGDC